MGEHEAVLLDGEKNPVWEGIDDARRTRLIKNNFGCVECDEDVAYWMQYTVERRIRRGEQTSITRANRISPAYCEEHLPEEFRR